MTDHAETEIQFVRRIIAMLLTLAGIAERAADRSYPVRAFVLWVLRRAETAAQDFVGVEDLLAGTIRGNGPHDAHDLADSFRELAAFLIEDLETDETFLGWWHDGAAPRADDGERLAAGPVARIVARIPANPGWPALSGLPHLRAGGIPAPAPRLDSS